MCLIIDANCGAKFANGHQDAAPVATWLAKGKGRIVIGGTKLAKEYKNLSKLMLLVTILSQKGQVRRIAGPSVDKLADELIAAGGLASDDEHIIALAALSGARALFSNDQALHEDFQNPQILNPKGRIYQNPSHAHILASMPAC